MDNNLNMKLLVFNKRSKHGGNDIVLQFQTGRN